MRLGTPLLAGAAALVGGAVAFLLAVALGVGGGDTTTVLVPEDGRTATTAPPPASHPALGNGFNPAAIYQSRKEGVVTIYAIFDGSGGRSQGSGFVVSDKGTILTNAHVITNVGQALDVAGADELYVEFRDRDRVRARIVGWDLFNDVGVIRVDPADHALDPVPLGNSDLAVVGAPVAAIGSPFDNQSSLSVGVVSATGRTIASLTSQYSVANAIQTDAPINKGSSGGPLFDAGGRVIGINAQIRSDSGNAEGVGFAIPVNTAKRAMGQLLATGKVAYAYIGIKTEDVTPGVARHFKLGATRGALVVSVEQGTPAARAGLRGGTRTETYNGLDITLGGDLILDIGGRRVETADDVSRIISEDLRPGQKVDVVVLRGGGQRTMSVTLGTRPPGS